jgi:hypothetical protein
MTFIENSSHIRAKAMYEQTQRIRELINKPITQCTLLKNRSLWYQLCSCLDVIEDTDLAIASYLNGEYGKSTGAEYLAKYGLLQALNVQQDAVSNLCKSLKMPNPLDNYPRLKEVKDIRIKSIGHPTKRKRKGQPTSYHFISRPTLKPDGFELLSWRSDGQFDAKDVSIPNLIKDQKTCLSEVLTQVIGELENREKAHKEKFRMDKLISCFPDSLNYYLSNVLAGTTEKEYQRGGKASLPAIRQALQDYSKKLTQRKINIGECHLDYGEIMYALRNLEEFYQAMDNSEEKPKISSETAYIFAFFLQKKVEELISMAREIDEDYSS